MIGARRKEEFVPFPFEDYSSSIRKLQDGLYEYTGCANGNLLNEATLTRLVNILENKTYAILSAYRKKFSKKENIKRNRILRGILNANKMGPYQLVGHWLEAPDGKKWDEVPKSELTDTIKRSYLVCKPDDMSYEEFKDILTDCLTIDNEVQDCGVIHRAGGKWYLYFVDGTEKYLGDRITFNKIGEVYSQWVKRMDKPFVFECLEEPGSISGKLAFKRFNIKYLF